VVHNCASLLTWFRDVPDPAYPNRIERSKSKDRSLRQLLRGFLSVHDIGGVPGQCRSCRRLRSFDLDLPSFRHGQNQKIAACGSSYRETLSHQYLVGR